jgi:hypothetical protein
MRAGHSQRDISPAPGVTLSGFAARCNRPSEGIDDPIFVHALAVEDNGEGALLLAFDLLALGEEITAELALALEDLRSGQHLKPILCCTHTHSAPAAIELIGCGIPDRGTGTCWSRRLAKQHGRPSRTCARPGSGS